MTSEAKIKSPFVLPTLEIEAVKTSLSELSYMVTVGGQGKHFLVSQKLAELITHLKAERSIENAARTLSVAWNTPVTANDLRRIVEEQMVPKGLAFPADHIPTLRMNGRQAVPGRPRVPLWKRFLTGQFEWTLMGREITSKICSPLTNLFDISALVIAIIMIIASRWLVFGHTEQKFLRQLLFEFSAADHLAGLFFLIAAVLFHEFGHIAAQIRYGLPAGPIGFRLYFYMPALFANVTASWRLKPSRRVVVDVAGIYFQAIIASLLYLAYAKTAFLPLLTTALVSDFLCLIAINPFLKFDGYWLVSDALLLPNLESYSGKLISGYARRLIGQGAPAQALPFIGRSRTVLVACYAIFKHIFWVFLVFTIVKHARTVYAVAAFNIRTFVSQSLEGLNGLDAVLFISSVIRLVLFLLLLMAVSILMGSLMIKAGQLILVAMNKFFFRKPQAGVQAAVSQN